MPAVIKNDKKRSVYILKEEYLQQFLDDMRQEMIYSKSSQYISEDEDDALSYFAKLAQ